METLRTDVIIVGAGPTGLSLACQFVRYGTDFIIVEKNEGITPYSKAIGVQARTLEIFDQIGLARPAVEEGTPAGKARLLINGEIRGELDFTDIGAGLSPFPFVLMLEQSKNERLLHEFLKRYGKDVLWKTEFESFSQHDGGVTVRLRTAEGASQVIEAKYLVGCDGPKSLVRHGLGLAFEGSTFERMFYVADAQIDWKLGHDVLHICFSKGSFVIFFPLKGERRYRIVGVFPEEFARDEGEVLYDEIETRIKAEAKIELHVHDVEWFSTYKVHTRHVNRFSEGRGFLAGDAAHIHTPAGAQGMNTGIQDAYNLAWKMALVLRGEADEKLLETYNEERLENARNLLKTTDRLFEVAAGTDWFLTFFRTEILPVISKPVFAFDPFKRFIFPLLSQTGINYRQSSLSRYTVEGIFKVGAGDRMPYFLVDGESIYEGLRQPKFHILIFSDGSRDYRDLKVKLENEYSGQADIFLFPLYPQVAKIFGPDKAFTVLLRPDNHVGYATTDLSPLTPGEYFKFILGRPDKQPVGP